MFFRNFVIISPWNKERPLTSLEETWISFTKGWFMPSLVEIGLMVPEKIFKICQRIFTISWLSPLRKERGPSFEETWISVTQECFVPSLVEIGPVVLKKKMKMLKNLRQQRQRRRRTMDKFWSGELKRGGGGGYSPCTFQHQFENNMSCNLLRSCLLNKSIMTTNVF